MNLSPVSMFTYILWGTHKRVPSGGIIFLHVTGFFLHVNKCRSHAVHMRTVRFVSIAFVCDVACERAKISHVIICVFACERQYFTQEPQFSHAKIFCISHAFRVCVACVIWDFACEMKYRQIFTCENIFSSHALRMQVTCVIFDFACEMKYRQIFTCENIFSSHALRMRVTYVIFDFTCEMQYIGHQQSFSHANGIETN